MVQLFLLIILGFFTGLAYPTGVEPLYFNPLVSLFGSILLSLIYLESGVLGVRFYLRKFAAADLQGHPVGDSATTDYEAAAESREGLKVHIDSRRSLQKRHQRFLTLYRWAVLPVYAVQIFILHWPLVVADTFGLGGPPAGETGIIFVTKFLILLPFLLTHLAGWLPLLPLDRFLRRSEWGVIDYLLFQMRSYFALSVLPLLVLLFYIDAISQMEWLVGIMVIYPFTGWFLTLGLMVLLYLGAPWFLRIIWSLKELPAGELREHLFTLSRQAGVVLDNIFVWRIGRGRMANAMMVGLVPGGRYVVFTDTLLNNLRTDEIEAVFGHELSHARYRHPFFYLVVSVGYVFLAISVETLSTKVFGPPIQSGMVVASLVLMVIIYWGSIFRLLSHSWETQADLSGALITGSIPAMQSALDNLARLNGQSRFLRSIQHPSIATRIAFLESARQNPQLIPHFFGTISKKWRYYLAFLLFISLLLVGMIFVQVRDAPVAAGKLKVEQQAYTFARQGYSRLSGTGVNRFDEALVLFNRAITLSPEEPVYYIWKGNAQEGKDGYLSSEAYQSYLKAWQLNPVEPKERMYLYQKINSP